jgi:hypothetical protein
MNTMIRQAPASDAPVLIDLSRRTISASYRPFLGDQAVAAFPGGGAVDRYVTENLGRTSLKRRSNGVGAALSKPA